MAAVAAVVDGELRAVRTPAGAAVEASHVAVGVVEVRLVGAGLVVLGVLLALVRHKLVRQSLATVASDQPRG